MHPDGYVELRDRLKDVIISGGENISTIEVEQALSAHPGVAEAAVVGRPDVKWGEVPTAFVVASATLPPAEAELRDFVGEQLAGFKVPKRDRAGGRPPEDRNREGPEVRASRARGGPLAV
jgi:fatty-acyl-CoA synthase